MGGISPSILFIQSTIHEKHFNIHFRHYSFLFDLGQSIWVLHQKNMFRFFKLMSYCNSCLLHFNQFKLYSYSIPNMFFFLWKFKIKKIESNSTTKQKNFTLLICFSNIKASFFLSTCVSFGNRNSIMLSTGDVPVLFMLLKTSKRWHLYLLASSMQILFSWMKCILNHISVNHYIFHLTNCRTG